MIAPGPDINPWRPRSRSTSTLTFDCSWNRSHVLVREIGSAILFADLAITQEPREAAAAHIGTWLTALKDDKAGDTHGRRASAAFR